MDKKLKKLPRARTGYQIQGSLANDVPAFGGADYNAYIGKPSLRVRNSMGAVPREEANIEAEGGETLVGDIDGSTFPSFYNIKGPRHSSGGVPMNLPDDTFIFSDTQSMKITDPEILKMFGKTPKKGGYTPAELSKTYDINKYRKLLQDPDSNKMEKKTAEMMIKNYVMKLGALALAQESKKGFPQGIPVIAKPYMEANGITEEDLMPEGISEEEQMMPQEGMPQEEMVEEQMQEQPMPQQMPSGEPIAQPSMEEQMMSAQQMSPEQMQEAPMAMYGMTVGGYEMPFAQYGISLGGGNPNNYLGRRERMLGSGPFMAREGIIIGGTNMPLIMQNGGSTSKLNTFEGGGQITEADLTKEDLEVINKKWNGKKQAYIDFINTKRAIEENVDFQNDLYTQYQKDIENKENYTKSQREKLYTGYAPELRKLDKKSVVDQLLAQEERNARLEAFGLDASKTEQNVSGSTGTNAAANKLIQKNPDGLGDLDFSSGFKGQAAYIAYRNLLGTEKYKPYGQFQVGVGDEEIAGKKGQVSGIDQFNTNTTLGQRVKFAPPTTIKKCFCPDPITGVEKEVPLKDGKCECEQEQKPQVQFPDVQAPGGTYWPEWTTQDKLNLATAMRTRTGIEYPTAMVPRAPEISLQKQEWLAPVQAAQAAAAKNLDLIGKTATPSTAKQAIAASLEGDLISAIQNPILQTQAGNTGIENQERQLNYQADMGEAANRANIFNQYIDKVGAAENFYRGELNAKDALKTAMMNQGIKNAADIYNIQSEQYAIDPVTGVQIFKQGKPLEPEKPEDALEYAMQLKGSGLPEDMQELVYKTRYGRYGGPVYQVGGMVYGDTVYPFYYYE
jgi:hypothetical protein